MNYKNKELEVSDAELDKPDWIGSMPFLLVHVMAVVGMFYFEINWKAVALVLGSYYFRMWAITTAFHRYFSHRSFKTGRVFQFLLGVFASTSVQKGLLRWAALHRDHHRYSDLPQDVHSPIQKNFFWSHMGWILSPRYNPTQYDKIKDFAKYPELVWLNNYWIVPVVLYAAAFYFIGGTFALFWGFFFSTAVLWQGTFTVNSITHLWGRQRYKTTDQSRNSALIALITCGEGWHNNHHYYQSSARQGFFWWEFDFSYYVLKALEVFGIVWDVRVPPAHVRDGVASPRVSSGATDSESLAEPAFSDAV